MATIKPPESLTEFPLAIVKNMISLSVSGFGVVVALAWNEAIQFTVKSYIDPYLGKTSSLVSLLIYATVVTVLAVTVTMQLTSLEKKLEAIQNRVKEFKNRKKVATNNGVNAKRKEPTKSRVTSKSKRS